MSENEKKEEKASCACGGKCSCRLGRRIAWILGIIVAVLIAVVLVVPMILGPAVRKSIEMVGPKMLQVPVQMGGLKISLLGGSVKINDFVLGNPEGYKTDSIMKFDEVYVKIAPLSVFSDTIHVKTVEIRNPNVTYEVGLGNSNVGTLLKTLEELKGDEADEPTTEDEKPEEETKEGKKVVIDHVEVTGGKVRLSAKVMGGAALPIPLPPVKLNDLGKGGEEVPDAEEPAEDSADGISVIEATREILTSICTSVMDAVKEGGASVVDAAKRGGEAVVDSVKEAGSKAAEAGKNLLKVFKKD